MFVFFARSSGVQYPDIHVGTPRRGSTQRSRTNHPAKIRISVSVFMSFLFLIIVIPAYEAVRECRNGVIPASEARRESNINKQLPNYQIPDKPE